MVIHKLDHYFTRRSRAAWAKYAEAFRKISFARLQFAIVAFPFLQALALVGRQAAPLARIAFGLAHPIPQRLTGAAELARDRRDRGPLRRMLGTMRADHPNGPLS